MDGRKRTVQIKFRVTEEERALIEQKMKLVPTRNMEAYLRKMAIDGYIIQIDHADIKAMTAEIQKIGVNINQISAPLLWICYAIERGFEGKRYLSLPSSFVRSESRINQGFFCPYCVT